MPERPYSGYLLVGAVLYLVGAIGLTLVFHVPMNNRIAELDPAAPRVRGSCRVPDRLGSARGR